MLAPIRAWARVFASVIVIALTCVSASTPAGAADAYPDRVVDSVLGVGGGFNQELLPDIVLGGPRGGGLLNGSTHVLSLGRGGTITLEFVDSVIVDGAGPDFTVFENSFLLSAGAVTGQPFAEAGRVSVSQNGVDFVEFACDLDDAANLYRGCAGVYPVLANLDDPAAPAPTVPSTVPITSLIGIELPPDPPPGSGGDSFDLAEVGLGAVRFVRIVSGPGGLPAGGGMAGFDLDAVAAVNWQPADDGDGDGIDDSFDNCPATPNDDQADTDEDGVGNACDLCPTTHDPTNRDADDDGVGDACDPDAPPPADSDGDGVLDATDNCPSTSNAEQLDSDADGNGDACDLCPDDADPTGQDTDGDGIGDACDPCPDDASCGPLVAPTLIGGKLSREPEQFLTFVTPTTKVTRVSRDTVSVELWVNFGPTVDPGTLRVKVRGKNAKDLFATIIPGTSKRVTIPLDRRRTQVVFRIKGAKKNGARARDVERLVFRKKPR